MKLKDNFNLSHVIGFFVGVVVTVIFNWIVFKDPKRVTAPGVAALVAICTFSLALWSASQVKKWLNNKINETAYKQAEISMELLRAIIIDLFNVSSHLKRLMEANQHNGEYVRILDNLKPTHESCIENINKLIVVIESLPSWNINLIHKEIFSQAVSLMRENNFPSIVTRSVAILSNDKMVKDRKTFFMTHSPTIIMTTDTVLYRLEGLLKIPYYKKFEHILHHP